MTLSAGISFCTQLYVSYLYGSQEENDLWRGTGSSLDGSLWLWRARDQESVKGEDEEISGSAKVEGDTSVYCFHVYLSI